MPIALAALAAALSASQAAAVLQCPSGMKLYGTSGTQRSFCIDRARSAALSYAAAVDACAAQGKALCNLNEMTTMCYDALPNDLTAMTNGVGGGAAEWVDTTPESASIRFTDTIDKRFSINASSCSSMTSQAVNVTDAYRCCIR